MKLKPLWPGWAPRRRNAHQNLVRQQGGFSFVELMLALALIGGVSATSIWSLTDTNRQAAANRLFTEAQIVAANPILCALSALDDIGEQSAALEQALSLTRSLLDDLRQALNP